MNRRRLLVTFLFVSLPAKALAADARDARTMEFGFAPFSLVLGLGHPGGFVGVTMMAGRMETSQVAFFQWFPTDKFGVEPGLRMTGHRSDITDSETLALAGRANYYLSGSGRRSLFILAGAEISYSRHRIEGSDGGISYDGTRPSVTFGAGYRWPVRDYLSLRAEGAYFRFFDEWGTFDGRHTLSASMAVAVRF